VHPEGGCGFRKLGYYSRKTPADLRVPRWYCPPSQRTFSLLPDFAAVRVSATLAEIEQVVERFELVRREEFLNNEAAAACVGPTAERSAAIRWVNRRRRWVQGTLAIAIGLLPVLAGCEPSLVSVRAVLGGPVVLVRLRGLLAAHLAQVPAPLGFKPLPKAREIELRRPPHCPGPDPPPVSA
jgi:hypothetical protein